MADLNQAPSATANPGYGAQLNTNAAPPAGQGLRTHAKVHQDLHAATVRDPLQQHSAADATGTYPGNGAC